MSEVRKWLEGIGLAQYADAFESNEIAMDLLGQVDDQMLKDIGVSTGGHRLRIRSAIAKLTSSSRVQASESAAAVKTELPATSAERRQLTVMFCDLVGSTALSARLDPEDMREIIGAYHRCCAGEITKAGGFVAKYMGDGVLAYFGYPQAHEHDAERGVHAALSLTEAISKLPTEHHAALQVRIGIATGLVVVGDLIGEGDAQERGVVGDAPNLAARLQALAGPGQVIISNSTRRLTGGMFEYGDLGRVTLKGLSDPVQAWQVTGTSAVPSRFEAQHESNLTPLVGREEELELLLRRWQTAKTGEGQVVLLSGEPGIGKSRLTAALLERLPTEPHTRLRYYCSPQHIDSALYPIINQMERAAGLSRDDTQQAKLDKLDALLAPTSTSAQDAALFAEMLLLSNDGRYPTLAFAPQQRRQKTLEALILQMEARTRQTPVLMIFEDVHWIDPTSLEALARVLDRVRSLCVLLIVTFRPEFEAPWIGRPHVTALIINRLAERDIKAIIDQVVGNKPLPTDIRQDIIERTDGIPLFVEEMTKAVLEAESEGEAQRTAAVVPSPAVAVPASLHASLMARLDRLGPAKEVAQIGAAIGRAFSHSLLAAVVRSSEAELASALDRLIAAGLLFRQGVPPDASYLFKHALVQDAAYGTLLREPRCALHARIAETLESQFVEIAENQPEVLARHCTEAGLVEKAAVLWGKAGQRSLARSAMLEAEALLCKGLSLVSKIVDNIRRQEHELDLQVSLGLALSQTQGFHAKATAETYFRARQLCDELKRPGKLLPILYGQWVNAFARADLDRAQQFAAEILKLGDLGNDVIPRVVGYRASGATSLYAGDFARARSCLEQGLELYDPKQRSLYTGLTSVDTRVALLGYLAPALACCGQVDQARSRCDEAIAEARNTLHAPTLAHMLGCACWTGWCAHADASTLLRYADELFSVSAERELVFWRQLGTAYRGWCLATLGFGEQGVSFLTQALSHHENTLFGPLVLTMLADALRIVGRTEMGLARVIEAERQAEATQFRWCQCETLRMRGVLLTLMGDRLAAEDSFRDAISVVQRQGAKLFELRATVDLARLWRDRGKRREARDLLVPIHGWFTEGFDTPDLKEAKVLLDELTA